jgi:DNA-binding transcriptional LysR family regulator
MPLPHLDFNLLKALQALLDTRSVTQTGERLGLSQPAASRVVARLRAELHDPLLVRTAKGYVLTRRAESLLGPTRDALSLVQRVFEPVDFDPIASARCFRLATTDYGVLAAVAPLSHVLATKAPCLSLGVQPWNDDTLNGLEQGRIDLALYADDPLPPDFHYRDLYRESYAVLMRHGHPLQHAVLSKRGRSLLDQLADYPHVVASYPSGRRYLADDVLTRLKGPAHHVAIEVPYFIAAPWLLKNSDRVMLLPVIAAHAFAQSGELIWLPLPDNSLGFAYRLIWHERAHRDPGLVWLRREILSVVKKPPEGGQI